MVETSEAHTAGEGNSKETPQMAQMISIQNHTELCTAHVTNVNIWHATAH